MNPRIFLIEDDLSLQKSLVYILVKEGFSVSAARTGEEGLQVMQKAPPDLLLLDLVLPGMDGFEVCRRLRSDARQEKVLIVMLTGKGMVDDIARGLTQYADDYITKPFEPTILLARIQAVLRRGRRVQPQASAFLDFGDLTVDLGAREVFIGSHALALTCTEFNLLVLLARKPNVVFTRDQILNHIRKDDLDVTERVVDYQISGLRKKLGGAGGCIETVRGVGYKFRVGRDDP